MAEAQQVEPRRQTEAGALHYAADENPPHALAALMGFQVVALIITGIALTPLVVLRVVGVEAEFGSWVVFAALLISGISTVLQAVRIGPVGSGYVLFMGTSGAFIAVSIAAISAGGLPLLGTLIVISSFFQFFLALFGAIVVAWAAVSHVGGLDDVVRLAQTNTQFDVLSFTPFHFSRDSLITWSRTAGITASTFFAYITVLWWAFRRSDGGGEFIQRLSSVPNEKDAEKAAWFFNIMHYVVRTWPWILVALVALAIYPDLEDKELGYPRLMLDFLPAGVLGLVVASLLAAFMSTMSTLINWSASYMTNDLYARFIRPEASQKELVFAARVASLIVLIIAGFAAFQSDSIATVYRLILAIGTGPGLVLILRWYWWRINAWAELAAMVAGFVVGFLTSVENPIYSLVIDDFGIRLMVTAGITLLIWVPIMLLTRPENDEKLDAFYTRVRPGGPGWKRQQERTGIAPAQDMASDIQRVLAGVLILFGAMFAVGGLLLLRWGTAAMMTIMLIVGLLWLRKLGAPVMAPPTSEAPTHPS